jgi:hypothetical protein
MKINKFNFSLYGSKVLPVLKTYNSFLVKYPISLNMPPLPKGGEAKGIINRFNSCNNNKNNSFNNVPAVGRAGCISFMDYLLSGIVCLIFLLLTYYMFDSYFSFIISFYISLLLSLFVFDNFKYSSIYIIRLNQKFTITIITIFLSIIVVFYIMDYFDIFNLILCEGSDSVDVTNSNCSNDSSNNSPDKSSKPSVIEGSGKDNYVPAPGREKIDDIIVTSKEVLDKVGDVVTTIVKDAVGPFIENIATAAGAGSAGGVIGGKIISSMPAGSSITHKIIAGAGAATITAAGVAGGIKSVNAAFSNKSFKDSINSNFNTVPPAEERSPSPKEEFIHSVLEPSEITSPLETILDCQIFFIILSLLCLLCIIMLLGMWVFNKYNINFIKYILGSSLGNNLMGKLVNIKFIKNMNNKLFISMIVVYTILLIFCLIFQIFIGVELRLNLDDYIEVHNHMKKSGIPSLGMFISNLNINKFSTYKIKRKYPFFL